MSDPAFARVKEVFEQQDMYNAVVGAGYMHHAKLADKLAAWAETQPAPLRIVDLGCGDAWLSTRAWRDANVAHYLGVDMSETSVAHARQRVGVWPGRAEVLVGELAATLRGQPGASANTVLASYSVHHLSTSGKQALLEDVYRVLLPGGTLLYIDAARRDDESREAYIARLTHAVEHDWTAMAHAERAKACAHIRESDFPETIGWMHTAPEQAGLRLEEQFLDAEFFKALRFTKPAMASATVSLERPGTSSPCLATGT